MKTTEKYYYQRERIFQLHCELKKRDLKIADFRTGGNEMLVNNWGNESSRAVMREYDKRWEKVHTIYSHLVSNAFANEYPEHLSSIRYKKTGELIYK